MNKITRRIPNEVDDFARYIHKTDDLQKSIDVHGYTIFPKDKNGKNDYKNTEGRQTIKNEPIYKRLEWTDEESKMWSKFRSEFDELYIERKKDSSNPELTKKLENVINECKDYDYKNHLLEKVSNCKNCTTLQREAFNIKQDILTYETPFREITFKYEKELPLNKFEQDFVKKYIALHQKAFEIKGRQAKIIPEINKLKVRLPALWEQIPVLKEKLDKAQNNICIPPPTMKGSMVSEVISFTVPTAEESQKRADDFNQHIVKFQEEVNKFCTDCDPVFDEIRWFEGFLNHEESAYKKVGFDEISKLISKFFDVESGSLEFVSVHDEHQEFLGAWSDLLKESDKTSKAWEDLIDEQKLFIKIYAAFIEFLQDSFSKGEDEEPEIIDVSKPMVDDQDDLRAETLRRYEEDVKNETNTYFDSMDWHIILDKHEREWDNKNKRIIMEKALAQHPEEPVLLIRYANMELKDQNFQKALELFKQVEKIGPPFHPNYYSVKAHVYLELKSPDQAIPLYRKLTEQQGDEIKWWRLNSYSNLVDIYDEKKDWDECIKISKALIAEEPDKDLWTTRLAYFFCEKKQFEEAEKVLKSFIESHPKSSQAEKQLGLTLMDQKEYQKAIPHFDKAFNLDKDENYGVLYYKGNSLYEIKRFDEAAVCFETCVLYFKLEKDYNLAAGKCYLALNQNYLAKVHYKRALFLDRECKEAINALVAMQPLREHIYLNEA